MSFSSSKVMIFMTSQRSNFGFFTPWKRLNFIDLNAKMIGISFQALRENKNTSRLNINFSKLSIKGHKLPQLSEHRTFFKIFQKALRFFSYFDTHWYMSSWEGPIYEKKIPDAAGSEAKKSVVSFRSTTTMASRQKVKKIMPAFL